MKVSTIVIWAFEFGITAFMGICAWNDKEYALLYCFVIALAIILAIFGNKQFTVKSKDIEIDVKNQDKKDG